MSKGQEVLDFNLYLGPDDLWRAVEVPPQQCRTEQDCGWQPWCRIEGRCKRAGQSSQYPQPKE